MNNVTASGSAFLFGLNPVIESKRAVSLQAAGSAISFGSVSVTRKLPSGGLTDFGIWNLGQPDTAMSRDIIHSNFPDTSTAKRSWLAATAPTEYVRGGKKLWNSAVYAGIGMKWTGLDVSEKHAWDNVQFEKVNMGNLLSWDASSWEGRRCYTGQAGVTYSQVVTSDDTFLSGSKCGKITYLGGGPPGLWGYWINPTTLGMAPCTPNEVLNASVSVRMTRAAWWTAGLQFYDVNMAPIGTWWFNAAQQHPGGNQWDTSYVYTITAPAGAVWANVAPHISVNSTPSATDSIAPIGEVAYCDMHRIWKRPYRILGTPATYSAPRKLAISVQANRVNLVSNPGFDNDLFGWGASGYGSFFPNTWDNTTGRSKPGALKFTIPATATGMGSTVNTVLLTSWSTSNVGGFGWKPATTYTTSLYVKLGAGCPSVKLLCGSYTPTAGVLSTDDALANHPELIDGEWIRLWGTFTTSGSDDGLVGAGACIDSADIPPQGATFWVDDVLSEAGTQLLPYFDGSSPGSDFLWAGTPMRSSSHYYRGFRSSAYRLNDIVAAAVPHGTEFTLLYAQPPQ